MEALTLIALALVAAAGAILLALGIRGRRVNDHPICRACRFDLVGVHPEQDRCPECGGDLRRAKAVRAGARRVRRGLVLGAIPLVLVGVGGVALSLWASATSYNWYAVAPDWLLETIASSRDRSSQSAAAAELAIRIERGELGGPRRDRIIQHAAELQADPQFVWMPAWGDVLEKAIFAGVASRQQVESYLARALHVELSAPEKVREGETAMIRIVVRPDRVGSAPAILALIVAPEISLEGSPVTERAKGPSQLTINGVSVTSSLGRDTIFNHEPGLVTLTCTTDFELSVQGVAGPGSDAALISRELSVQTEIVPRETPLVEFIPPDESREEIAAAFSAYNFRAMPAGEGAVQLDGTVQSRGLPLPCAFDIFVRAGEEEHFWGRALFPAGSDLGWGTSARIGAQVGAKVDLVLRASEEAAIEQGVDAIWGGEIVLEGVPVSRPGEPSGGS